MRLAPVVAAMSVVAVPALALSTASAAAAADGITISPAHARAGQQISLSVADCSVGSARHWVSSKAFAGEVTLGGKADTGDTTVRIRAGLAPGTYAVTAHCGGSHIQKGSLVVVAGGSNPAPAKSPSTAPPGPSASPDTTISARPAASHSSTSSTAPYWAAGAGVVVLAAAGGAFLIRRRSA